MSAFFAEIRLELRSRIVIVFWATISIFLTVTGPYGTYVTYSLPERMVVCVPVMATLMVFGMVIRVGVGRMMRERGWLFVLVTAAAAVVLLAPFTLFLLYLLVPTGAMNFPGLAELALLMVCMSLGFSALRSLGAEPEPVALPRDAGAESRARIMQRIDPELRGALWAMSVRDHYVEVITSAGSARVLLRLSDAIAEADPIAGAQVHRSHWVAWDAVEAVEREGAKLFLRLSHGLRVPVSKNHREKLEERGLK